MCKFVLEMCNDKFFLKHALECPNLTVNLPEPDPSQRTCVAMGRFCWSYWCFHQSCWNTQDT